MKKIRKIAMLLAHIGIVLSVFYLIFFWVCTVRADRIAAAMDDPETEETVSDQDKLFEKAVRKKDFSVLFIGKALSGQDNPARDNLLLIVDLIIPALFLASGILLQIASVRKKRKSAVPPQRPTQRSHSQSTINRRLP